MNETPGKHTDPPGDPRHPQARLVVDRYWRAAEDAAGFYGLHVFVAAAPSGRYEGLITIGCGRGMGYSLPQLADKATRQLEAAFNVPASRVKWGLRLLTPLPPPEHAEDEDEEAALPTTPKHGIGRTDMFRVEDRGNVRVAVAVPTAELRDYFEGVLIHTQEIPKPPRSLTGFAPYQSTATF